MVVHPASNEALWFRRFGPPVDVLERETSELPPLAACRVRVAMTAAAINPSDLIPITGAYRHRVVPPRVAGYEGCGMVVAAAEASLEGRRVLPLRGDGTWQRFVDADPTWLVPVPDDIPDDLAARAYINPLAAMLMLERQPVAGRRVLLTAGGSACARLLGAWALAAGAREVVAVHRSPAHAGSLAALGLIPIRQDDPALASYAARADVAFDAVGGPIADAILAAMPRDAAFVSYGLLSGETFRPRADGASIHRFHLRDRLEGVDPATWRGWFERLWPLLRAADLPDVRRFPLRDWRGALAAFEASGRSFKPMLMLGSE
ncbi:zinc-dependent alcohol dehydrogenase family protein [Paludisphaera mucosa]|uniref:Zinc-dependent alcohol dehydrogenase family protein n=1 Tax=Paludisphaera mucosa TaxID=3030827 RepID=A0ABT6F9A7_9BACT|nr:zinc-dependent alcohol dehydrogenase family protein [Paludisphaera mucosa]MDG3004177.1 zinc-dependent alcohol dehydrogenase family protein [Paludisphaera mucosa]